MGKISEYISKAMPLDYADKLIGTNSDNGETANFSLSAINALIAGAQTKIISEISQLGALVGGKYQLEAGRYIFSNDIALGTNPIELITLNGSYIFDSVNLQTISYTGTEDAFITGNTGQVFIGGNFFLNAPNGNGIKMVNGNSLILDTLVFLSCKTTFNISDSEFLTVADMVPLVNCQDGSYIHNVAVVTMVRPQWNAGQDLGGTGFNLSGTINRLIISSLECETQSSEAVIYIDPSFTGVADISGVYTKGTGTFFKAGSLTQDDPKIDVNVSNVPKSSTFCYSHVGVNAITTISTAGTPVKLNAVWDDVSSSRIDVDPTGRWTYLGLEESNITVNGAFSLDPNSNNQEIEVQVWKNGVFVPQTEHQSIMNRGGQIVLIAVVPMATNDYIECYIQNNTSTSNITTSKASWKIG